MKVCVLGLRGVPDVSGGIETHCQHLLPRLAQLRPGDTFTVIGRKGYIGDKPYRFESILVRPAFAIMHPYFEAISNSVAGVWLARFAESSDVIHIHAIGPALVAPLARLFGMKVVLTHHGDDFNRSKWNGLAKAALRIGERLGLGSAHVVLAVSPSLAERLRHDYPAKAGRIFYVPNGADHLLGLKAQVSDDLLTRLGLTAGRYVASVGRLVPEKRFDDLIEAHARSGMSDPLVIVGGGEKDYEQHLHALAGPNVIFTGSVGHADVASIVSGARLFVLASSHEGLPIAALEAAALGAPIVMSDIVPNKDLGLPDAHYYALGDTDQLAEKLLVDPETFRAPDLVGRFNWDRAAKETSVAYDFL